VVEASIPDDLTYILVDILSEGTTMITEVCVCPMCKGPLVSAGQVFVCAACSQEYPIVDGIPDFFVSQPENEEDQHWRENLVWLDSQMAEARDTIWSLWFVRS
jgi:uncharacterized protein YbaR (Trm112 family)